MEPVKPTINFIWKSKELAISKALAKTDTVEGTAFDISKHLEVKSALNRHGDTQTEKMKSVRPETDQGANKRNATRDRWQSGGSRWTFMNRIRTTGVCMGTKTKLDPFLIEYINTEANI